MLNGTLDPMIGNGEATRFRTGLMKGIMKNSRVKCNLSASDNESDGGKCVKNTRRAKSAEDRQAQSSSGEVAQEQIDAKVKDKAPGSFSNPIYLDFNHLHNNPVVRTQAMGTEEFLRRLQAQTQGLNSNKAPHFFKAKSRLQVASSLNECFLSLERGDFRCLIKNITNAQSLVQLQTSTNELSFTLLDFCALLKLPNEFLCALMLCQVELGPITGKMLQDGPSSTSILARTFGMDPVGSHLVDKLKTVNQSVQGLRRELSQCVERVKVLASRDQPRAFEHTSQLDSALQLQLDFRDYLNQLIEIHKKQTKPAPVHSLRIMVSGTGSVIVKIVPPMANCLSSKMHEHSSDASEDAQPLSQQSSIALRYRVEWSTDCRFLRNCYSVTVDPLLSVSAFLKKGSVCQPCHSIKSFYTIANLKPVHQRYFFRAYALFLTGWSGPTYSIPASIQPATWYQCSGVIGPLLKPNGSLSVAQPPEIKRYFQASENSVLESMCVSLSNNLRQLARLGKLSGVLASATEADMADNLQAEDPDSLKRRRSLRSIFAGSGVRFAKNAKSGLYLAMLCHSTSVDSCGKTQHLILLNGDSMPLVRVMNEEPSTQGLKNDLLWLYKLAFNSGFHLNLKLLNEALRKINAPSSIATRLALLDALVQMQTALGLKEQLGIVYPRIFRGAVDKMEDMIEEDSTQSEQTGANLLTSLILLVKNLPNPAEINLSYGLKWMPMGKYLRRHFTEDIETESLTSPVDGIISKIREAVQFCQGPIKPELLQSGLYLVFVQMQTHLDQSGTILTIHDSKLGYMMPIQRVRNRFTVSKEEWAAVRRFSPETVTANDANKDLGLSSEAPLSESEQTFLHNLIRAWQKLGDKLALDKRTMDQCRIYLPEVVQLTACCSLIVITPPIDQICLAPKKSPKVVRNGIWIPLNYVEASLAAAFDPEFYQLFANLSAHLDIIIPMMQHAKRQSFDDLEISMFKSRIDVYTDYQNKIDSLWKCKRWISDTLNTLRNRQRVFAISLPMCLLDLHKSNRIRSNQADWSSIYDPTEQSDESLQVPPPIDVPNFQVFPHSRRQYWRLAKYSPNGYFTAPS
ncbi:Ankyrin-repeat and fibronectin type III domain-containing 1 [Cichlidogyrus casuarinus]|uniref:Ankyrin-repeat and fibronectin type III domain-containing 1 n=1 Tax=Cichlidogyrus casuarinus TaxID=1844966 RepID=A0ABD2PQ17_9PLAT